MSSSGRPLVRLGSTVAPVVDPIEQTKRAPYEPHLFDLAHAVKQISSQDLHVDIPAVYFSAASVDSAKVVGNGASFTASVRSLPPGPTTIESTVDMGGWSIIKRQPAPPRPNFILYKTARVAFSDTGAPRRGFKEVLQSVLTELHALTYPTLLRHPNIIAFLGLAWATNEFRIEHKLPALIVEYAEHGTLSDVLGKENLAPALAQALCFDIANGLQAIHSARLVHGDIKAENVLICQGQDRMVAKLGDFGYSVVEESEQGLLTIGGTRPWKAPEAASPLPLEDLHRTDIYSLGLLVWSVSIDGQNPFDVVLPGASMEALEYSKKSDSVYEASCTRCWAPFWFLWRSRSSSEHVSRDPSKLQPLASAVRAVMGPHEVHRENATPSLDNTMLSQSQPSSLPDLCAILHALFTQHPLFSKLDRIFEKSLKIDPKTRNLQNILEMLQPGVVIAEPHITRSRKKNKSHSLETMTSLDPARVKDSGENSLGERSEYYVKGQLSWSFRGFKSSYHSWEINSWIAMGDQTPYMQELLCGMLELRTDSPSRFLLAAASMNGYGCNRDFANALQLIRTCAEDGHRNSQGYLYRLHHAAGIDEVSDYDLTKFLVPMFKIGSRAAFHDLLGAKPSQQNGLPSKEFMGAWQYLRELTGGVGAHWFADANMLHGWKLSDWFDHEFLEAQVRQLENVNTYAINMHGDTLLHMTASCAKHQSRKFLVEVIGADVNSRNACGDTPLISLCRAGSPEGAMMFLRQYKVDASLAAHNGETALHWLISFPDAVVEHLAKDLIAQGAIVDASTTSNVSYGEFRTGFDCDFLAPGTPLQWAVCRNRPNIVKVLLQLGANAELQSPGGMLMPIGWAAYFHHAQCFQLMLENLEQRHRNSGSQFSDDNRRALTFGPHLTTAIHSSNTFSMMLRNGPSYLTQLHALLDIFRQKTRLVNMGKDFGHAGWTALYYAIAEGHDEVAEYIINEWPQLNAINESCGTALRTPVLEAIRWNRLSLVKLLHKRGADIHHRACNPYDHKARDWSALHVMAEEGYSKAEDMLDYLMEAGLPIDCSNTTGQSQSLPDIGRSSIFETNADTNSLSRKGETPLSCALRNNRLQLCDRMISLGANVNATSTTAGLVSVRHPTTILGHIICSNARHSYERLKFLLSMKATDYVVEPSRQLTALHRAALGCDGLLNADGSEVSRGDFDWENNAGILRQLLSKFDLKEQVNARCLIHKSTALHLAVQVGNATATEILLDAGADSSIRDENGLRADELVSEERRNSTSSPSNTRALLEATVGQDAEWKQEAISEIATGDTKSTPATIRNTLVSQKLTTELESSGIESSATEVQASSSMPEVTVPLWPNLEQTKAILNSVKTLRERGLNVAQQLDRSGSTTMHFAAEYGHLDVVEQLIEAGIDVNRRDWDGRTSLYMAAEYGHSDVLFMLMESGAIVDLPSKIGCTPLHLAAEYGHLDVVNILIAYGANVDALSQAGRTPLYFAAEYGHTDIVKLLVEIGTNIEVSDRLGRTALHIAALYGHLDTVKHLVLSNANVFQSDSSGGHTPLSLAVQEGHLNVAQYLVEGDEDHPTPAKTDFAWARSITNSQDLLCQIPIHFASQKRYGAIVEMLHRNHADAFALDCYGRRSYYWIGLDPDLRPAFEKKLEQVAPSGPWALNHALRRSISKLTSMFIQNRTQLAKPGFNELGHCLIYSNRPEDAATAFEQLITIENVHYGLACDSCNSDVIRGLRHVCTVCAEINVCDACWEKEDRTMLPVSCFEHDFLTVPRPEWSVESATRFNAERKVTWLRELHYLSKPHSI